MSPNLIHEIGGKWTKTCGHTDGMGRKKRKSLSKDKPQSQLPNLPSAGTQAMLFYFAQKSLLDAFQLSSRFI